MWELLALRALGPMIQAVLSSTSTRVADPRRGRRYAENAASMSHRRTARVVASRASSSSAEYGCPRRSSSRADGERYPDASSGSSLPGTRSGTTRTRTSARSTRTRPRARGLRARARVARALRRRAEGLPLSELGAAWRDARARRRDTGSPTTRA
jgi:hypothetical protein